MFKDEFQRDPTARLDILKPTRTATIRTLIVGDDTYTFDRTGRVSQHSSRAPYSSYVTEYEYVGDQRLPSASRTDSPMDGKRRTEYRRDGDGYIIELKDVSERNELVFAYDISRQPGGQIVFTHKWKYRQRHTFENGLRVLLESWDDMMLNVGQGNATVQASQQKLAYRCERRNGKDGTWMTIERRIDGDRSGVGEVNGYDSKGRRIMNWFAYFNQPLSDEMGGTTTRFSYEDDDRGNWIRSSSCKSLRADESDKTCGSLQERKIEYW